MASHHHHHHLHHLHPHYQSPPPPTHCCCTPPITYCTTPPPHDHLVQLIPQQHQQHNLIPIKSHIPQTYNIHPRHQSTITSLIHRIEALESSLLNHHHLTTHQSLRHSAARIIQTHFRSFLVRRSRTLSHLKHLASIKSSFISLTSSFSSHTHFDFPAISLKAVNLLLQLDSIQACDPMVVDGKRSISRDLVQFLDSIEEIAAKNHMRYVNAAKNSRSSGQKVHKARNSAGSGDDEKKKLLKNLRGRVEKISKLCKVYANDEEGSEPEDGFHVDGDGDGDGDDDGVNNVLIGRKSGESMNKNGEFVLRKGVQPRVKKSVRFADNGNVYEVFSSRTGESDESLSSDDRGDVLEDASFADVEDVVGSSQGAEVDEEVPVVDSGGSTNSSDDGEKSSRRDLKNDDRNVVKKQLQELQEKLLFSAPVPLKMENRSDFRNSKGVKILT